MIRAVFFAVIMIVTSAANAAWNYSSQKDKMGGTEAKFASTRSMNAFTFSSPYGSPQHARLVLRSHPRYGHDVILSIERGQFMCQIDGCKLLVKFDDKNAETYHANGPEDHSTTVVFLNDYQRFMLNMETAKRLYVEATFYMQGSRIFEFNVANLKWDSPLAEPTIETSEKSAHLMRECNTQAGNRKGTDRKNFMVDCLKSGVPNVGEKRNECESKTEGQMGNERTAAIADCLAAATTPKGGYIILVAAFDDMEKAKQIQEKIVSAGIVAYTEVVPTAKGKVARVRAGPYASRELAEKARNHLKYMGFAGNIVPN